MKRVQHTRALAFDFIINTVLTIVEYAAGIVTGSAAILADGSQNLTDSLVLSIAFICERLTMKPHLTKRTVSQMYRITASLNAIILMGLAIFIAVLAVGRIIHPQILNTALVITIGVTSIVINFWAVGVLFAVRRDVTVAAPYVGLLFSGFSGIGVLISGLIARVWGIYQIDGIVGTIIAALLFIRSSHMLFVTLRKQ